MILGLSISTFTWLHTVLSLIGIFTGVIVLIGMLTGHKLRSLTAIFLATTVLTSVTGFMFPFSTFGPSHLFGVISLAFLAVAIPARYAFRLRGSWRWIFIATAVAALYLNSFVGVVQAFQKLPALNALAPNQSEPPFLVAQAVLLLTMLAAGAFAAANFRPASDMRS